MNWSADRCTSGWTFPMCRETHVHFVLRATISTLNETTNSPVDTDISTVPCKANTVPRRTSNKHTEHSSKSVLLWSATSKTNQAQVTTSHPARRTVDPRSCVQLFSACRGRKETDHKEHAGGLGWRGIRWQRVWHGTYAWRREALMEGMRPQSGRACEARARSRSGTRRNGGVGGRAAKRQRVARKLALDSGGQGRHG